MSDAIQAVIDNSEFKDDLSDQIKTIETNMKNYYQSIAVLLFLFHFRFHRLLEFLPVLHSQVVPNQWYILHHLKLNTQKEEQAELKFKSDAIQAVIDNSEFKDDLSDQIKTINLLEMSH